MAVDDRSKPYCSHNPQLATPMNESLQKILEIDTRHNELLDRLAELDAKIQAVLEEWSKANAIEQTATAKNEPVGCRL